MLLKRRPKTEDQRIVLGWMGALVGPGGGVGGWLVGVKNHRLMYGNMVRPQVYHVLGYRGHFFLYIDGCVSVIDSIWKN